MKFPRNARMLRNHFDVTAFASVFFCLLIFILLASLVYTPGAVIQLPDSISPLSGVDGPVVAVALDKNGQIYFQNQMVLHDADLIQRLKVEAAHQAEPLTLVVMADKNVTLEQLYHVRDIAATAGIRQISQQVLPRIFESRPKLEIP
jgi:biopolymer transport protein ExbD